MSLCKRQFGYGKMRPELGGVSEWVLISVIKEEALSLACCIHHHSA